MAEVQSQEAPKITLYWLDQSRAQRIIWLLEELHLPYNIQIFHRNKDFLAPPELEKVHPLGKSPVISITPPNRPGEKLTEEQRRVVIAESGWMTQYLVDHFPEHGSKLVPKKWKDGMEGQIGGETEAWMRYSYYLHYTEGSFMPILVMGLVISRLKGSDVPFIVRPITSIVADRIFAMFLFPGAKKHLTMLEQHLSTSGGRYLCGDTLTAADILMSFPLVAAKDRLDEFGRWDSPDRKWATQFPKVKAYVDLMNSEPGYQRSVEKIKELDGGKFEMYENV